ncbi:hypothetical protein WCQ02_41230 [Paraburkholderia tropica]|uniref:hypothetical protein n=1 Tax=Paraburkholderia tropica TaxID=92647 RepID=UPI0030182612
MLYVGFLLQALLLGLFAWNFFDETMGRAPLRMVGVGIMLCIAGIGLGATIANFQEVRIFSAEHNQLELVSQLINVAITAAEGMSLRPVLSYARTWRINEQSSTQNGGWRKRGLQLPNYFGTTSILH